MSNLVNSRGEALNRDPLFKNTKRRLVEEIHTLRTDLEELTDNFRCQHGLIEEFEKTYLVVLLTFKNAMPDHEIFEQLNLNELIDRVNGTEVASE